MICLGVGFACSNEKVTRRFFEHKYCGGSYDVLKLASFIVTSRIFIPQIEEVELFFLAHFCSSYERVFMNLYDVSFERISFVWAMLRYFDVFS